MAEQGSMVIANGVVLLHGLPGTEKTNSCQAVSGHIQARTVTRGVFIHVGMEQLTSMWIVQSSEKVAQHFRNMRRLGNPSGIVLVPLVEGESDSMRRRVSSSFIKWISYTFLTDSRCGSELYDISNHCVGHTCPLIDLSTHLTATRPRHLKKSNPTHSE